MISPLYRIAWKSKITGFSGHGTATFSYDVAKEQCEDMDKEFPDISHWLEAV